VRTQQLLEFAQLSSTILEQLDAIRRLITWAEHTPLRSTEWLDSDYLPVVVVLEADIQAAMGRIHLTPKSRE